MRRFAMLTALGAVAIALFSAPSAAQVGKNMGLLNPNLATEPELTALPGMNATLAKWLVDNRPFMRMKQVDDHLKTALDSTARIALYERMWLPINLNDQNAQEIAMIPRPFRRMAHEFDEYAPYRALAVWDREIDKYIDEPELSRFRQYVFVPINANTGSDEYFNTIPGMKPAVLAAIKAGRPWANADAFRTAITRAADAKEAARISRYLVFQ